MNALNRKLDRFCMKHPRFGIPNLMLWIIVGNAIVYLLSMIDRTGMFTSFLFFSPRLILQGQIWRLFTFIFYPVSDNLFLAAISLYFYYFIGTTLERQWGTPKFTIFYFSGVLFHIIAGMLVGLLTGHPMIGLSSHYLNLSMFFAFASMYPDVQVLLFFVIPIKMKWLAWLDAAYFLLDIVRLTSYYKLIPVIALLNYIIFFGGDLIQSVSGLLRRSRYSSKTVNFHSAAKAAKQNKGYLHKCAVCGKTDTDYPDMEFRYCSKCNGYYCYCKDHINNHVHIE